MLTLLILRNPKKWHCFFQPLMKIFHFSIVLKNSKTTKKFKLGIFQKSGWFWNLSHLSAQNWHENKGKVWQDTLYILALKHPCFVKKPSIILRFLVLKVALSSKKCLNKVKMKFNATYSKNIHQRSNTGHADMLPRWKNLELVLSQLRK